MTRQNDEPCDVGTSISRIWFWEVPKSYYHMLEMNAYKEGRMVVIITVGSGPSVSVTIHVPSINICFLFYSIESKIFWGEIQLF